MTMRHRPRIERKDSVFTTSSMTFTLPAAATTVATGGLVSGDDPSDVFEARTGKSLRNATVARIWLRGLWVTIAAVTTPVIGNYFLGAIVLTEKVEDVDFPELATHAGDWMLHDARTLLESTGTAPVQLRPINGPGGAMVDLDNRSKRLIRRDTDKLFIAAAKSVATEEDIVFRGQVTVMWLVS